MTPRSREGKLVSSGTRSHQSNGRRLAELPLAGHLPWARPFPGRTSPSSESFMKEARTRKGTRRALVTCWVGPARHGPDLWTPSPAPSPSILTLSTSAGVGVKGLLLPTHVPTTSWPGRHHHGPRGQPQNTGQQLANSTFAPCPSTTIPSSSNRQDTTEASRHQWGGATPSARGQAGHLEVTLQRPYRTSRQSIFYRQLAQLPSSFICLILINVSQPRKQIERLNGIHKVTVLRKWGAGEPALQLRVTNGSQFAQEIQLLILGKPGRLVTLLGLQSSHQSLSHVQTPACGPQLMPKHSASRI